MSSRSSIKCPCSAVLFLLLFRNWDICENAGWNNPNSVEKRIGNVQSEILHHHHLHHGDLHLHLERLIITMTMIKKKELIFRRGFDTFFGQLQLPHKVAKHIFCTVFTQSRILNTFLHIPLNIPFHMVMIKTQFDVCISFGKLSFSQAQEISFCFNKFQRNSR